MQTTTLRILSSESGSASLISVDAATEVFTSVCAYIDFESTPEHEHCLTMKDNREWSDEDEEGGRTMLLTQTDARLVVRVLPIPSVDADLVGLMNMPGRAWRRETTPWGDGGTQEEVIEEEMSGAAYIYNDSGKDKSVCGGGNDGRSDQSGNTSGTDEEKTVRQYHREFKWRHRADLSSLRSVSVSIADQRERPEESSFSETKCVGSVCSRRASRGEEAVPPLLRHITYKPSSKPRMQYFANKTRIVTECANSMRFGEVRNSSLNLNPPLLEDDAFPHHHPSPPLFSVEKTKACAAPQLSPYVKCSSSPLLSPSLLRDPLPLSPSPCYPLSLRALLPDFGGTFTRAIESGSMSALAGDGKGAEPKFFPNSCDASFARSSPSAALHASRTLSNMNIAALSSIEPSAAP